MTGEQKTKPTQHSVTELRSRGIQPDVIVCRSDKPISENLKRKISYLCDVAIEAVVSAVDAPSIYEIPLVLHEQGLDALRLPDPGDRRGLAPDRHLPSGRSWCAGSSRLTRRVKIGIVGKYVNMPDAYMSVVEALRHAGLPPRDRGRARLDRRRDGARPARRPTGCAGSTASSSPAVSASGASRAWWPRPATPASNAIPCLGLCLGLQVMVISVARDWAGLDRANSREFDTMSPHPVIDLMPDQAEVTDKGGTMRLGSYQAALLPESKVARGLRHARGHRAPPAPLRVQQPLQGPARGGRPGLLGHLARRPPGRVRRAGATIRYWVGTQAHPEFKSRPDRAHPLFRELVAAALERADGREPHLLDLDAVT